MPDSKSKNQPKQPRSHPNADAVTLKALAATNVLTVQFKPSPAITVNTSNTTSKCGIGHKSI